MSPKQPEEFGQRVKGLREAKGLSQGDLAKQASLAPAALSRLLTGDRTLRMDQAVALARALGVSVVELTQGTTAEAVVSEWVPRAEFDQADRARAEAEREVDLVRAEGDARTAEANALRDSVRSLTGRVAELERDLVRVQAEAATAGELSRLNAELARQVHELQAETARLRIAAVSFKSEAEKAIQLANGNYSAWQSAMSRLHALEGNLVKANNDKVAVGVVTAALAGIAGAMLASPATSSRGRSRG